MLPRIFTIQWVHITPLTTTPTTTTDNNKKCCKAHAVPTNMTKLSDTKTDKILFAEEMNGQNNNMLTQEYEDKTKASTTTTATILLSLVLGLYFTVLYVIVT